MLRFLCPLAARVPQYMDKNNNSLQYGTQKKIGSAAIRVE